ncbi:AAA family ATPase [Babesia caballi]|uniref:AAA family ATPase n=1 Tax=Babesia caballi TaxID=5871 RepID=A0AAV4LZK6_BABCB|nr:AAA family ATPase [Babesia caballi]
MLLRKVRLGMRKLAHVKQQLTEEVALNQAVAELPAVQHLPSLGGALDIGKQNKRAADGRKVHVPNLLQSQPLGNPRQLHTYDPAVLLALTPHVVNDVVVLLVVLELLLGNQVAEKQHAGGYLRLHDVAVLNLSPHEVLAHGAPLQRLNRRHDRHAPLLEPLQGCLLELQVLVLKQAQRRHVFLHDVLVELEVPLRLDLAPHRLLVRHILDAQPVGHRLGALGGQHVGGGRNLLRREAEACDAQRQQRGVQRRDGGRRGLVEVVDAGQLNAVARLLHGAHFDERVVAVGAYPPLLARLARHADAVDDRERLVEELQEVADVGVGGDVTNVYFSVRLREERVQPDRSHPLGQRVAREHLRHRVLFGPRSSLGRRVVPEVVAAPLFGVPFTLTRLTPIVRPRHVVATALVSGSGILAVARISARAPAAAGRALPRAPLALVPAAAVASAALPHFRTCLRVNYAAEAVCFQLWGPNRDLGGTHSSPHRERPEDVAQPHDAVRVALLQPFNQLAELLPLCAVVHRVVLHERQRLQDAQDVLPADAEPRRRAQVGHAHRATEDLPVRPHLAVRALRRDHAHLSIRAHRDVHQRVLHLLARLVLERPLHHEDEVLVEQVDLGRRQHGFHRVAALARRLRAHVVVADADVGGRGVADVALPDAERGLQRDLVDGALAAGHVLEEVGRGHRRVAELARHRAADIQLLVALFRLVDERQRLQLVLHVVEGAVAVQNRAAQRVLDVQAPREFLRVCPFNDTAQAQNRRQQLLRLVVVNVRLQSLLLELGQTVRPIRENPQLGLQLLILFRIFTALGHQLLLDGLLGAYDEWDLVPRAEAGAGLIHAQRNRDVRQVRVGGVVLRVLRQLPSYEPRLRRDGALVEARVDLPERVVDPLHRVLRALCLVIRVLVAQDDR